MQAHTRRDRFCRPSHSQRTAGTKWEWNEEDRLGLVCCADVVVNPAKTMADVSAPGIGAGAAAERADPRFDDGLQCSTPRAENSDEEDRAATDSSKRVSLSYPGPALVVILTRSLLQLPQPAQLHCSGPKHTQSTEGKLTKTYTSFRLRSSHFITKRSHPTCCLDPSVHAL